MRLSTANRTGSTARRESALHSSFSHAPPPHGGGPAGGRGGAPSSPHTAPPGQWRTDSPLRNSHGIGGGHQSNSPWRGGAVGTSTARSHSPHTPHTPHTHSGHQGGYNPSHHSTSHSHGPSQSAHNPSHLQQGSPLRGGNTGVGQHSSAMMRTHTPNSRALGGGAPPPPHTPSSSGLTPSITPTHGHGSTHSSQYMGGHGTSGGAYNTPSYHSSHTSHTSTHTPSSQHSSGAFFGRANTGMHDHYSSTMPSHSHAVGPPPSTPPPKPALSSHTTGLPQQSPITQVSPPQSPITQVSRDQPAYLPTLPAEFMPPEPDPRTFTPLLPPKELRYHARNTLVLDLDETLVHSSFKPITLVDILLDIELEGVMHTCYVRKRPFVEEFLARMAQLYEVVVLTASLEVYADPLLDELDLHGEWVHHRLFRDSCANLNGNYIKDLSYLGRPLHEVIIIDNSPTSYLFQPRNAIPITSWFDDPNDTELRDLMGVLERAAQTPNVYGVLDQHRQHLATHGGPGAPTPMSGPTGYV